MHKTFLIKKNRIDGLVDLLKSEYDFEDKDVNYGFGFKLRSKDGDRVNVNIYDKLVYDKRKVLFQGSNNSFYHRVFQMIEEYMVGDYRNYRDHIGVDESGKGDFFGSLVVAGVLVTQNEVEDLVKLGVQDSKKLDDEVIKDMAREIIKIVPWTVVKFFPVKYNKLYSKIGNVNKLLGWGHARVIENILEEDDSCDFVVLDKFSKIEGRVLDSLMTKGKKCEIKQIVHGESDIAVAAASIIARAEFVRSMKKMSQEYDINFPLGATHVKDVKQKFISKYGEESLHKVAKTHFKI
jgi:ribonuclease HIII